METFYLNFNLKMDKKKENKLNTLKMEILITKNNVEMENKKVNK